MGWSAVARTADGTETAFFFGDPGREKYAVLHEPPEGSPPSDPVLVIHPHFGEKLWAHRVLVAFARACARRGRPAMRFDLSGHGDSAGEFESFGFADLEADVDQAASLLGARCGGAMPALVGLRLGGTLAGRAAGRIGARTVLWEPVLDPRKWMNETLRANLSFQLMRFGKVRKGRADLVRELEEGGAVVIEGHVLSSRFYREALDSCGLAGRAFPGRSAGILAIDFGKREAERRSALEEAAARWGASTPAAYERIDEEPFWKDVRRYRTRSPILFDRTLDWIEGRPIGGDGS